MTASPCSQRLVSLRCAAVLPCLLALAALAPAPADAAFPGRNGAVAYVGKVDGVQNLLARTGGVVRGLLKGGTLAGPEWSPQGRRIAVVRSSSAGKDIWVVGPDGKGARQVTATGRSEVDPTWSPGGDEIAYAEGSRGARHIYAIGADGIGLTQVTFGSNDQHDPAWSVRGQIAYAARNAQGDDLYVVAAHGGKAPRRLTSFRGGESAPSWSPDGTRIAFQRAGDGIWVIGADGKRASRVIRIPGGAQTSPAWSPDGTRILFSSGRPGQRRIYAVNPNGRGLRPLSGTQTDGRSPDWQAVGLDPVIETAGDIACDPGSQYFNGGIGIPRHCGQLRTSNLLLQSDLWKVLVLGDEQYSNGEYDKFLTSYDPSWGRSKYLQRPVPGNHEYQTGAAGYFDYFNGIGADSGPAGSRSAGGYYSYDVGSWHIIALNSNCGKIPGGCEVDSPQDRWLQADLAAHPAKCTLAYWHSPLFSSAGGGDVQTLPLWQTLYSAGADVVLVGHHHFYERMAPQTAGGDLDPVNGIRQFTVGTGGMSIDDAGGLDPNSEALGETTFGVLKLTLHADSYDWRFLSASADPFTDVGSYPCH